MYITIHLLEWLKFKRLTTPTDGKDAEGLEFLHIYCWWKCRMLQPLWKTVLQFLKKVKHSTTIYPDIPLSSFYPREKKAQIHTKIYTWRCIATLFNSQSGNEKNVHLLTGKQIENHGGFRDVHIYKNLASYITEIRSLCAQHTVRPINTKHSSLEERTVLYRFIQRDGWLMHWEPQSYWKLPASPCKSQRCGMGVVSYCRLLGVRCFVLEVRSRLGNYVPVNLYQMNVTLCPGQKGQSPKAQLSHSKVPALAKRRRISDGSSFRARHPHPAHLSCLREPGIQLNWPSDRPNGETRSHRLWPDRWPLLLGHRDRDGGRGSPLPQAWTKASGGP